MPLPGSASPGASLSLRGLARLSDRKSINDDNSSNNNDTNDNNDDNDNNDNMINDDNTTRAAVCAFVKQTMN